MKIKDHVAWKRKVPEAGDFAGATGGNFADRQIAASALSSLTATRLRAWMKRMSAPPIKDAMSK